MKANLQERFADVLPRLSATERKIGEYLIRHPDEVVDASAVQIGAAVGCSDATVIRTVQTLGYSGLREVKREFLEELLRRKSFSAIFDHDLEQVLSSSSPMLNVLSDSASVLDSFRQDVRPEDVERALDILSAAARVHTFGLGPGSLIAAFFALHLNRFGFDARSMPQAGYRLADELMPVRSEDCVVLFAPYHQTVEIEVIVDHAQAVGAPVVLITEALGVSLGSRVAVVIKTPPTMSNLASEMLVPQTLSVALATQLASRDRDAAMRKGELFNELASRLSGSPALPSPPFLPTEGMFD